MTEATAQDYYLLSEQFITLANKMTAEGRSAEMVNAALMSASGVYATYTAAGNEGGLTEAGIDQVTAIYKANLENVQRFKQAQVEVAQNE